MEVEIINRNPYFKSAKLASMLDDKVLMAWYEQRQKLINKEKTLDEYNEGSYRYPYNVGEFGFT